MPYNLLKAIQSVKGPKNFNLYVGTKACQVLIGSGQPTTEQLKEVQAKVGNTKSVLKGVCFRDGDEGGVLTFATMAEPAQNHKNSIKTAMVAAKFNCAFDLRMLKKNEVAAVDGEASLDGEASTDGTDGTDVQEGSQSNESGAEEKKQITPTQGVARIPMMGTARQAQPNVSPSPQNIRQGQPTVGQGPGLPKGAIPLPRGIKVTQIQGKPPQGVPVQPQQPARANPLPPNPNIRQATGVQGAGVRKVVIPVRPFAQPGSGNQQGQPNVQPRPTNLQGAANPQGLRPRPTSPINPQSVNPKPQGATEAGQAQGQTGQPQSSVGKGSVNPGQGKPPLPRITQTRTNDEPQAKVGQEPGDLDVPLARTVKSTAGPKKLEPKDEKVNLQQRVPVQRPDKPAFTRKTGGILRVETSNADGVQKLNARAESTLASSTAMAEQTATRSFQKGNAKEVEKAFGKKPVMVKRKELSKLTADLEDYYQKILDRPGKPAQKLEDEAIVKAERGAAKEVDEAMVLYEKKKDSPSLEKLVVACEKSVEVYAKRYVERLKKFEPSNMPVDTKRLLSSADALLEAKLIKSEKLRTDLIAALGEIEKGKTEENAAKVQAMAKDYLKIFNEHAVTYSKVPGQERPEAVRKQEIIARLILDQADNTVFTLKLKRLGPPPWAGKDKQREGNDLIDLSRQIKAKDVLSKGKTIPQEGGESDVLVIEDSETKKVAFAFKSADGENSTQTGMPKGSGAIREAVTSKVMDTILEQTGFDFGFPKATIATIGGKTGALIEGLSGTKLCSEADAVKLTSDEMATRLAIQRAVPAKQLQKTMCAAFITGNLFDVKWDNIFLEGEGSEVIARPFDAGAGFLPTEKITDQTSMTKDGGERTWNVPLLFDSKNTLTPGAQESMDKDVVAAMLAIDVAAMKQTIDDEIQRHAATGLGQLLDADQMNNGLQSLAAAQVVLAAYRNGNGDLQTANMPSLATFVTEVQRKLLALYPAQESVTAQAT